MIKCNIYLNSWESFFNGANVDLESIRGEMLFQNEDKNIILTNIPIIITLSDMVLKIEKCISGIGIDYIVSDHELFTIELSKINNSLWLCHAESQIELIFDIYDFRISLIDEVNGLYKKYFIDSRRHIEIRNCLYGIE